jgi:thiol:disulfide interchange protein DsbD
MPARRNHFQSTSASGMNLSVRKSAGLLAILFCVALGAFPARAATTAVDLILSADTARPGDTVMAGVRLKMQPGWHTYWRNPGDAGIATTVAWTLPPGVTAGAIQWPVPEKIITQSLTSYAYNDEVTLLVPLKIAANAAPGPLELKAKVKWQECSELCVLGQQEVAASLAIGPETAPSLNASILEIASTKLSESDPNLVASAHWEAEGDPRPMILEWQATNQPVEADFFPYENENYDVKGETARLPEAAGKIQLRKLVGKSGDAWPTKIDGLLMTRADKAAAWQGREVSLTLPVLADVPAAVPASTQSSGGATHLLHILLYAFLGGLILNIMPCVLPVIALKILGFANQAGHAPARVRKLGLIYAAGILVSFFGLAALVIGFKSLGHAVSWGFQFEDPRFVLVLTVLIALVALNLFGVFEITLGGGTMQAAGNLAAKEGPAGAFFNGVLAVALATPCTAPFLASALGFAFTQPAMIIVLVFLTVGAGLAAPYVVLCWQPAWLRFLPKPGVWMERFKILMGFPMLGTAVWLFTLAASNYGGNGDLWLGLFLVLVAMAAWMWGQFVQRGRTRKGLAVMLSIAVLVTAYGYILEHQLDWRHPVPMSADNAKLVAAPAGIDWEPWSPEAIASARASNRPVLVDFTAKWCVTCQVFVKPVLESSAVIAKLKEVNAVALLENSFTKNETVVAELNRYDRAGVPLVLVFPADKSLPAIVLPPVLTPGIVLDALDKAAGH